MTRHGRGRTTYRCGGYSSPTGHCGALDCERCHPGGAAQMAAEEAHAEELEELKGQYDELKKVICAADELLLDTSGLEAKRDEVTDRISELEQAIEDGDDGHDDFEPDHDDGDRYDYGAEAMEWGGVP